MKKFALAALAFATIGATAAFAGPIEDRQAIMKAMAAASKDANTAAKATPFDAAAAKGAMQKLSDDATKFVTLFPKGTEAGGAVKTGAGPAIWTDAAGFKAAGAKLAADAKAAGAATDAAAFTAAFKTVQADCGGCHKTYRVAAN